MGSNTSIGNRVTLPPEFPGGVHRHVIHCNAGVRNEATIWNLGFLYQLRGGEVSDVGFCRSGVVEIGIDSKRCLARGEREVLVPLVTRIDSRQFNRIDCD